MNEEFDPSAVPASDGQQPQAEAQAPVFPVPEVPAPETPVFPSPAVTAAAEPFPAQPVQAPPPAPDPGGMAWPQPSPAAQEVPVYRPPVTQAADPYARPEAPAKAPASPVAPDPADSGDPKPGKKSAYAPMSSFGMAVQIFLMSIPLVGLILSIVWACGVCRKIARRNLARAWLILMIVCVLLTVALALVLRFCFPQELTRAFEWLCPGYTIIWD